MPSPTSSKQYISKSLTSLKYLIISKNQTYFNSSAMSTTINLKSPVFAGNPIRTKTPKPSDPFSPTSSFQTLKLLLSGKSQSQTHDPSLPKFKVLPFRKGRPLAGSSGDLVKKWNLGWLNFGDFKDVLEGSEVVLSYELLVYLGYKNNEDDGGDVVYWAIDVSEGGSLVEKFGFRKMCFVELRTLMVATDWSDDDAMGQLAIAGHARALLEWHKTSRFCGSCGEMLVYAEAGTRKQCTKDSCKKRIYPRVDPAVIMLVIDKENDRALLSKQSRFVPRMWSCLAGFLEPGESLEEAVRRETWEETGIHVGEVVYHSSQPWPEKVVKVIATFKRSEKHDYPNDSDVDFVKSPTRPKLISPKRKASENKNESKKKQKFDNDTESVKEKKGKQKLSLLILFLMDGA